MLDHTLILASRSPRRARLLAEAGYAFDQVDPPFADPAAPTGDSAIELARHLAYEKSRSLIDSNALKSITGRAVALTADTIVVGPDGCLLGQPLDRDDASAILGRLMGETHDVVTAIVLMDGRDTQSTEIVSDVAQVHFGAIGAAAFSAYLDSGEWQSKAGGYNYAELRDRWSIQVVGDPTTVIGLPMAKLAPMLRRWSIHPVAKQADLPDHGGRRPLPREPGIE